MSQDTELYQLQQLKQHMPLLQPGWEVQDPPPKLPKAQGKHTWTQCAWFWWSVLLNIQTMWPFLGLAGDQSANCKKIYCQLHRKIFFFMKSSQAPKKAKALGMRL